jgi:lipid-A-disaccharide synthase
MKLFISAGEPSGDLHAANLIRELKRLRPDVEIVGFGGPHMEREGARLLYPLVELAVMWFFRVLLNLHKFIGLANQAERYFRDEKPDAVILIDYPGFHWALAKRAKRHGVPVFYYVPPQIWAWAGWRVKKVRKYVDHLLCSLPFEPQWYRDRGVEGAIFVGHPYFDELDGRVLDEAFLAERRSIPGRKVAILPGSRTQEVLRNMPVFLEAASKLAQKNFVLNFEVCSLHERHRQIILGQIAEFGRALPIVVHAGRTPELIRLADVAWAVSGSVGLELMVEALPSVILYKVNRIDLFIARPFIKSRFISLVNLMADREVMPEYLTARDVSGDLADWASRWLGDPVARQSASQTLADLRAEVAKPGASARAASRIVEVLAPLSRTKPDGPHALGLRPHPSRDLHATGR